MRRAIYILFMIATLLWCGCERRPLEEMSNTHYMRVYIDENIPNVTTGLYNANYKRPRYTQPEVLRVILTDLTTGEAVAERFLRQRGEDERGTYYEGWVIVDPGRYGVIAYNFDTETTIVNDSYHYHDAKATTNEIAYYLRDKIISRANADVAANERIVYDPDHLFSASCGEIYIPFVNHIDTITTLDGDYLTAHTLVKTYYMQVRVQGIQYATSSVGLLTGMSGSSWLSTRAMDAEDNVTLYFEMQPGISTPTGIVRGENEDVMTIYTSFNTFGKLPNEQNKLEITFDFLTTYGVPYSETLDITELFYTPEGRDNQWLLIDHVIRIPDPPPPTEGGGGFAPSVDEWEDVHTDIII